MTINNQNEREALIALARSRVSEDFTIVSHGEVGEPSNGALLLRLADLAANFHRNVGAVSECLCYGADGVTDQKCPACLVPPLPVSAERAWDEGFGVGADSAYIDGSGQLAFRTAMSNPYRYAITPSPAPSVVTTVEAALLLADGTVFIDAKQDVYQVWVTHGTDDQPTDVTIREINKEGPTHLPEIDLPATVLTPTSPPPSEVRVTGEQVEAAARAIYEASAHGDSEDMARAAFAAAGIPVAGEAV